MKTKLLILLFFLINFLVFSQTTINGKLILKNPSHKEFALKNTKVFLKNNFRSDIKIDSTTIDENFSFSFKDITKDSVSLSIEPRNYPINTSYILRLKDKKNIDLEIPYAPICDYSKTDSICPKCKKIDKVVPIAYGLIFLKKSDADKVKLGGCVTTGCDPNWYCKRDDLDF